MQSPWTIEQLRARVASLVAERDEARYVASILGHAYEHDARPPADVVAAARRIREGGRVLRVLRDGLMKAGEAGQRFLMLSVSRLSRDRRSPSPRMVVAPGLLGRVVGEDEREGRSVVEVAVEDARRYVEERA